MGSSTDAIGVIGSSINDAGVSGESANDAGVKGTSLNGTGVLAQSTSGTGLHAVGGGASPTTPPASAAIFAECGPGYGLYATSSNSTGVFGESTGTGPNSIGIEGFSETGTGVSGRSTSLNSIGVSGGSRSGTGVWGNSLYGLAGDFWGKVHVTGHLTKDGGGFEIDHPLDPANKYLFHSFVESPDMKNLYDGIVVLDAQGEAVVELPPWFEALNQEFRYQLTPIGAAGPNLYIAEEISNQQFKIAGGGPGMKVCWQVTGSRKDAWAQANPLVVEQEKLATERDHYLHPELYGHSREQSIAWVHHPEILRRAMEEQQKAKED